MATNPKIVIRKRFTYQGVGKEYSNSYHFDSGVPSDFAHWHTLATNVIAAEKLIFPASTHIIGAIGFTSDDEPPVYTETFDVAGTLAVTGGSSAPGDCCALLRYTTTQRSSTHHPVYLYNYFHGAVDYDSGSGHPDGLLYIPQKDAIEAYAAAWIDGMSDGDGAYSRAGPLASLTSSAIAGSCNQWIRHRDFPR